MNNKEYMEYEGYRVIEAALLSYTSPAASPRGPENSLQPFLLLLKKRWKIPLYLPCLPAWP